MWSRTSKKMPVYEQQYPISTVRVVTDMPVFTKRLYNSNRSYREVLASKIKRLK